MTPSICILLASYIFTPEPGEYSAQEPVSQIVSNPSSTKSEQPQKPFIGLMLDLGVPDVLTLAAVIRPLDWLRVTGGLSHNLLSIGLRAGVGVVPFDYWVSPSLMLEIGHFFNGNPQSIVNQDGVPTEISYFFANIQGGLNFNIGRVVIFLRGGVSRVESSFSPDVADTSFYFPKKPNLKAWIPSLKLGTVVYF